MALVVRNNRRLGWLLLEAERFKDDVDDVRLTRMAETACVDHRCGEL